MHPVSNAGTSPLQGTIKQDPSNPSQPPAQGAPASGGSEGYPIAGTSNTVRDKVHAMQAKAARAKEIREKVRGEVDEFLKSKSGKLPPKSLSRFHNDVLRRVLEDEHETKPRHLHCLEAWADFMDDYIKKYHSRPISELSLEELEQYAEEKIEYT